MSDPMHDHWDQAYEQGKADGYRSAQQEAQEAVARMPIGDYRYTANEAALIFQDGWRTGYDIALQRATQEITLLCHHTKYEGCYPCPHDDAVAAIEALGGEQ